jgi:LPS sulfotransferase NodH
MEKKLKPTYLKPQTSYTIWFSQRTGSTLLALALASIGIAGQPAEWLHQAEDSLSPLSTAGAVTLRQTLWKQGSTPNFVFGIKVSFYEPFFSRVLALFKHLPECTSRDLSRGAVWDTAFPNSKHIFMTRRNKIQLAVSWWKAIQSGEWHRLKGTKLAEADLAQAYSHEAIDHLLVESVLREAGMQAFFSEAGIQPLTIVYEDFIANYTGTVRRVLAFLGLEGQNIQIDEPQTAKLADALSEEWVQRFRKERQRGWENRGW